MGHVFESVLWAAGLVWVVLVVVGLAYSLVRHDWRQREPSANWWDLEEDAHEGPDWDQARRESADSLRPSRPLYPQPVRDELLRLAGKVDDRRRREIRRRVSSHDGRSHDPAFH